jgi:hypothetical protein
MLLNNLNLSTSYNLDADGNSTCLVASSSVEERNYLLQMNVNFGAT